MSVSERWTDFLYREFHDVPRAIVADTGDAAYFLDSPFDEAIDDYRPEYTIYEMPPLTQLDLSESWVGLERHALSVIGTWPVADMKFDSTRRRKIDLGILDQLR